MDARGLLGLQQVALALGVHPATVVRWLDTGKVAVRKKKNSRGRYVFTPSDLRKLKRHKLTVRTLT